MKQSIKYRHELKFQCSEIQMTIIENRIKTLMQLDSHVKDGRYNVRSIYFDNYNNRCFFENERGVDPREKYRIRIYDASDDHISFECKRKERGKTYKSSCQISKNTYTNLIYEKRTNISSVKSDLLREFVVLKETQLFKPVVIVEYDRTPYVYSVGNVRITLDRNIRSSSNFQDFFSDKISSRAILPKGQHLLEIKYDELIPDYIKEVLQLGDLQQTTFSKFYLCRKYAMGGQL